MGAPGSNLQGLEVALQHFENYDYKKVTNSLWDQNRFGNALMSILFHTKQPNQTM